MAEPDLTCPECGYLAKDNRVLGLHRRTVHGVPGAHHNSRRKVKRPVAAKVNLYVQWLADHPGTYSTTDIAAAMGAEATRVGKTLSASKSRGQSVTSDGHGNWHYIGEAKTERLPVKTPDPKPTNGQVHFVSQQIVLLLRDSEGREWLASPR